MPDHPTFDELTDLHRRPDGPLATRWAAHVESCPACREKLRRMDDLRDLLDTPVPQAGREEVFRARARFLQAAEERRARPWRERLAQLNLGWRGPVPALMAGVLIGLLVWEMLLNLSVSDDPANPAPLPEIPVATDAGETPHPLAIQPLSFSGAITLVKPDGSSEVVDASLPLGAGATLKMGKGARLATNFRPGVEVVFETAAVQVVRADERDILLDLRSGTTAVDVAPLSADQSLAVTTPSHKVSVHGTRFAVHVTPAGDTLVGVSEGEVLVTPHEPDRPRQLVHPGQAYRFSPDGTTACEALAQLPMLASLLSPGPEPTEAVVAKPKPPTRVAFHAPSPTDTGASARLLLDDARQAQSAHRFDEALGLLDALRRRFPGSPESEDALYLTAENQLALGRLEAAVGTLERAERSLKRPSLRENALYTHGYVLQDRLSRLGQARAVWERYLDEFGNGTLSEEVRFALCRNTQQSGQTLETLHRCRSVADRHPNGYQAPRALLAAADAAYELGRHDDAADLYARYLDSGHRDRRDDALYREGKSLLKSGRNARASEAFKRFVSLYPRDARASEVRGILIGLGEE